MLGEYIKSYTYGIGSIVRNFLNTRDFLFLFNRNAFGEVSWLVDVFS
jgi:hypothetical protein